jgi:hypothetical protein
MDSLHRSYLLVLAGTPAILQFIKLSTAGASMAVGLTSMILVLGLALATMYLMASIVNALAPRFNCQKDRAQSRKTIAYAYTASLIGSIAILAPKVWMIAVGVAALYACYLLYIGLPATMKCPPENAAGYAGITVLIAVTLSLVASLAVNEVAAFGYDKSGSDSTADVGRPKSFFQSYSSSSEAIATQPEATPDPESEIAQPAVEALPPERLQPFVPPSLLGRQRTNISVERVKEMGVDTTRATAYFTDEQNRTVELQVTDLGRAKELVGVENFVNVEEGESNAGTSYEKTYREGGDLVTEKWNDNTSTGEYSVLIADRFLVKTKGQAYNIDELKAVTAELDLATLEGMVSRP